MKKVLTLCLLLIAVNTHAQQVKEPKITNPEWTNPYDPFRIAGNLYYVGTYDLCSYLITTPEGNILVNTGTASSGPVIRQNIEKLGFRYSDIKILLTMQAHHDHMGAMAAIQKETGARMLVDWQDSAVTADGGSSDYALGGNGSTFAPVRVDGVLHDHDTISLGGMHVELLHHPGHTKGSCSYLFDVKDDTRTYRVLLANMPSIVTERKFNAIPDYPGIAADYAGSLQSLKSQQFDIWFSSHASQFNLHKKHKPGNAYNPEAFRDAKGYRKALKQYQRAYNKRMAQQ